MNERNAMKNLKHVVKIFYAPEQTFMEIREKPIPWLPLAIVVLVSLAAFLVTLPMVRELSIEAAKEKMLTSPEEGEKLMKYASSAALLIQGVIGTVVLVPLWFAVQALVVQVLLPMVNGEGTFLRVFTAVSYAGLIELLGAVLKVGLTMATGTAEVHTDLTLVLPMLEKGTYVYNLVSRVDPFMIWSLFILGLGVSVLCGSKKLRTMILIYGLRILFICLTSISIGKAQ